MAVVWAVVSLCLSALVSQWSHLDHSPAETVNSFCWSPQCVCALVYVHFTEAHCHADMLEKVLEFPHIMLSCRQLYVCTYIWCSTLVSLGFFWGLSCLCTLCLPTQSATSSLGCGLSATSTDVSGILMQLPQPSTWQEKPFSGVTAALYLLSVYGYYCCFLQKLNLSLCGT